jgi:hypothetical protein
MKENKSILIHCFPARTVQPIIISVTSFLEVSFSHVSCSEFSVLPRMIISEQKQQKESDAFRINSSSDLPALSFLRKLLKSHNVSGICSSSNLPILASTTITVMPRLGQVRNVGGAAGVKQKPQVRQQTSKLHSLY